ncbi:hypothetical protein [Pilimelia anulata]|nr:hypothetical protein [Pilimelia anulata]
MTARRGNIVGSVAAVVVGAVVAGVGVFFVVTGVKDANQWAGVLGFFIGVAGLVVSGYSAVLTRRSLTRQGTPSAGVGGVSNTAHDGTYHGPVIMAGRDVNTAAAPAPAPSPGADGGAGAGSVTSTISGGTFHGEVNQGRDFTSHQPPGSTEGTAAPAGGDASA